MKLITILFCLSILISAGMAAETKVPLDRLNWSQSLPLNANITLNGGAFVGNDNNFTTLPDVFVYRSATDVYAAYRNGTSIDSDTIGYSATTRVINAAVAATPEYGTLGICQGEYVVKTTENCTAGAASYVNFYQVAIPLKSRSITIEGAGRGATILKLAPGQYNSTDEGRALIMYSYCTYADGGGDGTGPNYDRFTLRDITFDGDVNNQTPYYHDGAGLYTSGSVRSNATYERLEFCNSPNNAFYLGYNGGGWEVGSTISDIYTHDNWGGSQIDNTEDLFIDGWRSENDGYGFWTASHIAIILDGMLATSGHMLANNINIVDGCLDIFGYYKDRDGLSMRLSNVYIDATSTGKHAAYIRNCNNVTIADGTLLAGSANYAVSALNVTGITLDDLEMRGLRGIVVETGYRSDVKLDGCDINTTGDCFRVYGAGSTATLLGRDLNTSDAAAYLVNVQAGAKASLIGCHGSDNGLIYVSPSSGVLEHSGTSGLGIDAYGATSVADGGTIAHGMKKAPTYAIATGSLAGTTVTVTAKDATKLTIDLGGVTTTQTVYWHAVY